jgi:hypothetical protein
MVKLSGFFEHALNLCSSELQTGASLDLPILAAHSFKFFRFNAARFVVGQGVGNSAPRQA